MKRVTMELGGPAPSIVFDDADVDLAGRLLSTNKLRNAGQVCVSPTRLLVQEAVYDQFVGKFTEAVQAARIGDGMESSTQMGPMANPRRMAAMEAFIGDAVQKGASLKAGGTASATKAISSSRPC